MPIIIIYLEQYELVWINNLVQLYYKSYKVDLLDEYLLPHPNPKRKRGEN